MTFLLPAHWLELVTWPQSQQRCLGNVKELMDILVSTNCLFHNPCEEGNSIIPMIFTDAEKLAQRKNNLPKSTLLVSDRPEILTRLSDSRICAFKNYIMQLILEQHGSELHGATYMQIFFCQYVLQYYTICGYGAPTVKLYVDFQLHGVGGTPTPALFKGQLYCLSKEVIEIPMILLMICIRETNCGWR